MIEKENEYRAALYCHLSSDDAYLVESGSIQTQKALLTQYCRENNIPIYDTYADDGFSGTNFERPDFKRMLGDLEKHKANVVIVKTCHDSAESTLKWACILKMILSIGISGSFQSEKILIHSMVQTEY